MKGRIVTGAILGLTIVALLCWAVPYARADEPSTVGWKILEANANGEYAAGAQPGGDDKVLVQLIRTSKDLADKSLLVIFKGCSEDPPVGGRPILNLNNLILGKETKPSYAEWKAPGPRWRMCPEKTAFALIPGAALPQFNIEVDFLRLVSERLATKLRGLVYEVTSADLKMSQDAGELAKFMGNRMPLGSIVIDFYYLLSSKGTWMRGTYAKIFGDALRAPEDGKSTGLFDEKKAMSLPVDLLAFRSVRKLPGSFQDDKGARLGRTLELIKTQGSGLVGRSFCDREEFFVPMEMITPQAPSGPADEAPTSHTLSGIFSTRWSSDHSLHPGFGFRVEAWTNETGSWKKLASDWVQANGTWSLGVPSSLGFQGKLLRMLYRSYNDYYAPQNQAGSKYSWRDPDALNIGATYYAGHRYADTDGGTYNGVGELVDAAMNMWSRLYWDGGINPVPSSPIKFYFPNTWYDCGDGSGVPWSCANTSGEIWLIASHGTQADVVTHEMGHQLNNKYWNNKRPAGSGGSHTLTGCYPSRLGMALREGFANFMPAWVGYPGRSVADGGFSSGRWALDYDAESRFSPPNCANGWENEVWVARTFWDLHDTRSDGDDILWFIHKGAVISLFLSNGIAHDGDARDMRYYENIYRDAATDGHEGYITDIFEQNRM
jgi:hypothetical protein